MLRGYIYTYWFFSCALVFLLLPTHPLRNYSTWRARLIHITASSVRSATWTDSRGFFARAQEIYFAKTWLIATLIACPLVCEENSRHRLANSFQNQNHQPLTCTHVAFTFFNLTFHEFVFCITLIQHIFKLVLPVFSHNMVLKQNNRRHKQKLKSSSCHWVES